MLPLEPLDRIQVSFDDHGLLPMPGCCCLPASPSMDRRQSRLSASCYKAAPFPCAWVIRIAKDPAAASSATSPKPCLLVL